MLPVIEMFGFGVVVGEDRFFNAGTELRVVLDDEGGFQGAVQSSEICVVQKVTQVVGVVQLGGGRGYCCRRSGCK